MEENSLPAFITVKHASGPEVTHYSALYEGLPSEFRTYAQRELNETEDNIRNGLRQLREYAKKYSLQCPSEDVLMIILRTHKYDLKKAENKLKKYVQSRQYVLSMLADFDLSKMKTILEDMPVGILPYRDKHGRVIICTRPYGLKRVEEYEITEVGLTFFCILLYLQTHPLAMTGCIYIGECKAPDLYVFYSIFKGFKQYMWHVLSLPLRIQKIDVVNENQLVHMFYSAIRPLLPAKLAKRIQMHGNTYKDLHENYHPDILPDEFEGNFGPMRSDFYKDKILDFVQNIQNEAKNQIVV